MSSLFSALRTASTALDVFSRSMGNEEINVANASTPGYAALRTNISPIGSDGPPAGSLDYVQVTASGDAHADALVRAAFSQAGLSQTLAGQLTPVTQAFDITGASGVLAALQKFSTAFANVSVHPNDQALRSAAIASADRVASAFRQTASQIDNQTRSADDDIRTTVGQINRLAVQIGQYNIKVRGGAPPDSGTDSALRGALDQLSSLVDSTVLRNSDGSVSVLVGGQQPLVLGDQVFALSAAPANQPGSQIVSSGGGGGPVSYSGKLGALLAFRNDTVTQVFGGNGVTGSLNQLAKGFAVRVNSLLSSGYTPSGSPGVPAFTFDLTDDSNVARTIALNPALTQAQLAAASAGNSNGVADTLAKLTSSQQAADQIAGVSFTDFFSGIAAALGQKLSDANDQSAVDTAAVTSAQSARQQATGVSLDDEAVAITAYQRAYQANAKVVSVIDDLTQTVVNLIK